MMSQGYEEIEHTADLALRVWGEDFYSLLIHSAQGMYALMGVVPKLESRIEINFQISQDSLETILVDFLSEVLYLVEDKKLAFRIFAFSTQEANLEVRATGNLVDSIDRNIKAVTFHNLDIKETTNGLATTITFDV